MTAGPATCNYRQQTSVKKRVGTKENDQARTAELFAPPAIILMKCPARWRCPLRQTNARRDYIRLFSPEAAAAVAAAAAASGRETNSPTSPSRTAENKSLGSLVVW